MYLDTARHLERNESSGKFYVQRRGDAPCFPVF